MYRNEHEVGQAIRDSGLDRGQVFVDGTMQLLPGSARAAPRRPWARACAALGADVTWTCG